MFELNGRELILIKALNARVKERILYADQFQHNSCIHIILSFSEWLSFIY